MRTPPVDSSLFTENRARLTEKLPSGTLACMRSNLDSPTNADEMHPYRQNSDLYYLTGILQEQTALILFPSATLPEQREILFIREGSEETLIWEGKKHSKKDAQQLSGIKTVKSITEFPATFRALALEAETLALLTNEHARATSSVPTGNDLFIQDVKRDFPLHPLMRLNPLLTDLRMIKSGLEVEQITHALSITEEGFRRILRFVKPGVGEWEVEAEYAHEFLRRGAQGFAYTPIVASGENACVLHYIENSHLCADGDLLLMDVASEWNGWKSDMTRTIPVNGSFTPRQRDVYEAVLRIMRYAETILRPGISMKDYQEQVMREMGKELVQLGLLKPEELEHPEGWKTAVRKYYMHGTSHQLGIDVHDVTAPHCTVSEGMVFTIEPGIYIREENLGIRLEDNYLIGAHQNENLSASIPIEPDEIEELMSM